MFGSTLRCAKCNQYKPDRCTCVSIDGLQLFKSLIKDGCEWHGDTLSLCWSEVLFFTEDNREQVLETLVAYEDGKDYKISGFTVCIA